ncbi:MAG: hypothetical protein V4552_06290 [Pseudomonadota bacterium]
MPPESKQTSDATNSRALGKMPRIIDKAIKTKATLLNEGNLLIRANTPMPEVRKAKAQDK